MWRVTIINTVPIPRADVDAIVYETCEEVFNAKMVDLGDGLWYKKNHLDAPTFIELDDNAKVKVERI